MTTYAPERIEVPGGWIYHGAPLSHPVLVSDPKQWAPADSTAILAAIAKLSQKVTSIMATLADIQTAETDEATAITAVVGEIAQLESDLAAAQAGGSDPAAIQAIVDQIHANTDKLKAALPPASANTPPAAA